MLRLKRRDGRRTKEYSVTYQNVKSKEGKNVMRKPIEMLAVTQQDHARQQEQECDTAASRQVCMKGPERRRDEQERDTAARRWVRMEDPERRREEQEHDTAAHRRVRTEDQDRWRDECRD